MQTPAPQRIVILGGGYAGLTAAARIAEAGSGADVVLIDSKPQFVERIRLHEVAAGSVSRALPYDSFMESRGGSFLQATVSVIDPAKRLVRATRADGSAADREYDTLIYALGSYTDLKRVPGATEHASCLDTVSGASEIAAQLPALVERNGTVLIVGGGLTAIEAACEFAERFPGLSVVLAPGRVFGPDDNPGGLSPAGFQHVMETFGRLNIEIAGGARVSRLHPGEAELETGEKIPFDLCVWGAGFAVPALARDSGISVNADGKILTDETLASVSHPDIVAVGDAALVVVDPAGECRMSCAAGRPMGERAAGTVLDRLAGNTPAPFVFAYSFRCVSLGRDDGLIQFVDRQDRPREEVWTGARGARWKEYICRRTLNGVGFDDDLGPPPDTPPQFS